MKILRLELFGFKSFKDRTIVTFDQPITAIVGSNGCGKSNVVDALYWVMGDMSPKHLRGTSMTDVIFSGSRDAAALDMAEVTLVLERDPEKDPQLPPQFETTTEIQITRRYFRSGESEYLINKIPCRLRDIQEFFMDTGMGAKAYSIIEQGAIGRMVAQKPEERRLVIEEVAGVMKFKARKAETERKLENSRLNLQRIDDILMDLQKQITSLKRQADRAEKFKQLSQELKSLEIRVGVREWLERHDNRQKAIALVDELKLEVTGLETQMTQARQRLDEARGELATLETAQTEAREHARAAELELKGLEGESSSLQMRDESLQRRRAEAMSQTESLESRIAELGELLATLESSVETLSRDSSHLASEIENRTIELEAKRAAVEEARTAAQTERRRLHEADLEQTRLAAQLQGHQKQLSQLHGKEESLKLQIESLESDLRMKESERQATLSQLEAAFTTRSDLESEKTAVDEELARLESEKGEKQALRDAAQHDLTVTRIRKEQLEALERSLAGVDETAKEMALKLREMGVTETLLADRIRVPASLEKAVEAVLSKHLQRVLVSSVTAAEELKRELARSDNAQVRQGRASLWLSEFAVLNRDSKKPPDLRALYLSTPAVAQTTSEFAALASLGSATEGDGTPELFLPLASDAPPLPMTHWASDKAPTEIPGPDSFVASSVEMAIPAPPEVAPSAVSVLDYLMNHPAVVGPLDQILRNETGDADWHALVQGTWVIRDLNSLKEILDRLEGLPINWVTLEGDVLTADGLLDLSPSEKPTEGAAAVGLVQRKREIQDLRRLEEAQSLRLTETQEELDRCIHALGQAKEKFRALTQQLASLNPDVENYSRFLREVEARVARLTEKRTLLGEDLAKTIADIAELGARIKETTASLHECDSRRTQLQIEVERLDNELQIVLSAQKDVEASVAELSQRLKVVDRELSEVQSKRAAADQERVLSSARRDQLSEEIETLSQETAEVAAKLEEISSLIGSQRDRVGETKRLETEVAAKVEQHKAQVHEILTLVEELGHTRQKVSDRIRDVEQELAVNDVEIRTVSEKLSTQYQIDPGSMEGDKLQELTQSDDLEELADPATARQRALQLRQKIDGLGNINMVAAEEYDESARRYEYLFVQRQDLFDAISQLEEAIDRIDRESRTRFAEAFAAVNEAFTRTFPLMFGGGHAELRLTNPDNMLETGVEIIAQPPGKKLQSVTLLSGGEKALTAVSLIFGIFSIKPSPFCVLDEVDAPLDDANVGRFNNQVREMCKISQVIMITHHKKTMESADALFGVTMERPGISKIASAKLTDIERTVKGLRG